MRIAGMIVVVVAGLLSACASPSDGPTVQDVTNARVPGTNERIPVIDLANAPVEALNPSMVARTTSGPGLTQFQGSGAADERLRPGDVIDVTILDTGEEGLFSPTATGTLNLGRFTVDQAGFVTLPFVGRQRVVDSSPAALQSRIVAGLRGSAVNPDAVVTVVDKPSASVTVNGNVRAAGRFPLTSNRERVLDAIALAGGTDAAPGSAGVTLLRNNQRASTTLDRVMSESNQNVHLQPGDQIFIEGSAASFTAFGAFKSTGEFEFEPGKMNLSQGIARAGGLLDDRANARNVFLIRNQQVYDASAAFASAGKTPGGPLVRAQPVVYRINMRDISNLVLMQNFPMQAGDILYATNANMADFGKLLTVFQKAPALPAAPLPGN